MLIIYNAHAVLGAAGDDVTLSAHTAVHPSNAVSASKYPTAFLYL